MSFNSFYRSARQHLAADYPSTKDLGEQIELERLLSPHRLRLPRKIADQAAAAIAAHHRLLEMPRLHARLIDEQPWLEGAGAGIDSILMAYDFHTTSDGRAYLIEVNTNAAAFLLTTLLYKTHGLPGQWNGLEAEDQLWRSFQKEAGAAPGAKLTCAIVDAMVSEQRMYVEFLMYRDWLQAHGWGAEIVESKELALAADQLKSPAGHRIDFVYNRLTDFYLEEPQHQTLREAYLKGTVRISPHPLTYLLFADKGRLAELATPNWLEQFGADANDAAALRQVLIPTYEPSHFGSADEIWNRRKELFFKPRQSHGSKSVYRGASVSRKVFERLMSEDIVIQDFVPAQSWPTSASDHYMENWKFDVRFFAYAGQIQLAVARSYQGQVTNFSSTYGGLTAIDFVS